MNAVEDHASWTISREVGLNYTLSGQVIYTLMYFSLLQLEKTADLRYNMQEDQGIVDDEVRSKLPVIIK